MSNLFLGESFYFFAFNSFNCSFWISYNFNILKESEIRVINSSEVNQKKHIRLNDETLFQFDCIIDDNQLILKLSELDALAPFIYIKEITLDEIRKCHKAFKSCEDLNEVKEHIDKLFKNKRISLDQDKSDKTNVKIKFKISKL